MPRNKGKIHGGDFPIRFSFWGVEVGMTVKEEKPKASTPPQREGIAKQDTTIAAEDKRKASQVKGEGHTFGEVEAECADAICIEDVAGGVTQGHINWDGNAASVANVGHPLKYARLT
jgi:hypothetical protein